MNNKKSKTAWFKGRLSNILFGLFFIAFSLHIKFGDGEFYYHWGSPVSRLTWILWFIIGLSLFVLGIARKTKDSELNKTLICTKCFKLYREVGTTKNICPACKGTTDEVQEFYRKNPDYISKSKMKSET